MAKPDSGMTHGAGTEASRLSPVPDSSPSSGALPGSGGRVGSPPGGHRLGVAVRVRQVVNVLNLSTPLGLLLAIAGRARIERGPRGVLLARGYAARFPAPRAPAVTIGDVVLLRLDDERLARRPRLLDHEARHCTQYAFWLGPFGFLPAYLIASAWSWWHTGDFALANAFERRAGLVDGGYLHARPEDQGV